MPTTNEQLLARVQSAMKMVTTSDLGSSILNPTKRDRFVRTLSESTSILDEARRIDMSSHTHDIDRVGFASRILRGAVEGVNNENRQEPDFYTNTLESIELMAITGLTDSTLEDNIEREGFEDTLLDLIADRAGLDLEELFLAGDTTSTDPLLSLNDGWLTKSANEVTAIDDGTGITDFDPTDVESMFDAMIGAIPRRYLRNRNEWTFWVHWDIEDEYRNILRARGTGLGDTAQTQAGGLAYKGIGVRDVSTMPAGTALLVPSSNLVYGIHRDIRIEPDRQPKQRATDFVTTMRVDADYEDENASVVATGFTG